MSKILLIAGLLVLASSVEAQTLYWDEAATPDLVAAYTFTQQIDNGASLTIVPSCTANTAGGTTCSVPFPEPTDGLTHTVVIAAINTVGSSIGSLLYTDPSALAPPPLHFAVSPRLTLTWTQDPASQNVTGYEIDYGTVSGVYPAHLTVGKTSSATLTGLQPQTSYFVVIRAKNAAGLGPPSPELQASTP